jgi:hypothetical protein
MSDKFISIKWYANDVMDRANHLGIDITEEDSEEILDNIRRGHDCEYGINWDTIDCHIEMFKDDHPVPEMFEDTDGRWTCGECGYKYSAMSDESDLPRYCECQKNE